MRVALEVLLAGDDGGTFLGNLVCGSRRFNLEVDLFCVVSFLLLLDLVEAFFADSVSMGLLGFFSG